MLTRRKFAAAAAAAGAVLAFGRGRFMAAGLTPATEYWYRFTDADGNGGRVGRMLTAPGEGDAHGYVKSGELPDVQLQVVRETPPGNRRGFSVSDDELLD